EAAFVSHKIRVEVMPCVVQDIKMQKKIHMRKGIQVSIPHRTLYYVNILHAKVLDDPANESRVIRVGFDCNELTVRKTVSKAERKESGIRAEIQPSFARTWSKLAKQIL